MVSGFRCFINLFRPRLPGRPTVRKITLINTNAVLTRDGVKLRICAFIATRYSEKYWTKFQLISLWLWKPRLP